MKKDFKFPPTSPVSPTVPSVPALPERVPASATEPEPGDGATKEYQIAPHEVPPPPVEKEKTQSQTQDDDGEEDVGLTVEVDLS